jgi:hypothetical protein
MRFPATFRRQKGGASADPALGSDSAPTTTPPSSQDNVLACKIRDINGWPVQRIAVCWTSTGGGLVPINGDLYFWEAATQHWYKINDAPLSLKPNQLFFFDVVSISDPPITGAALKASGSSGQAGALQVQLVLTDPGAAAAVTYVVAMGPDLTTVGT